MILVARRALAHRHVVGASRWLSTTRTEPPIRIARDDMSPSVAVLTLNDPDKLNAMTAAMGDAVTDAVAALQLDTDLRALVITGAGRAFSAGGDMAFLDERRRDSPTSNAQVMLAFYRVREQDSHPAPLVPTEPGSGVEEGPALLGMAWGPDLLSMACSMTVVLAAVFEHTLAAGTGHRMHQRPSYRCRLLLRDGSGHSCDARCRQAWLHFCWLGATSRHAHYTSVLPPPHLPTAHGALRVPRACVHAMPS